MTLSIDPSPLQVILKLFSYHVAPLLHDLQRLSAASGSKSKHLGMASKPPSVFEGG